MLGTPGAGDMDYAGLDFAIVVGLVSPNAGASSEGGGAALCSLYCFLAAWATIYDIIVKLYFIMS